MIKEQLLSDYDVHFDNLQVQRHLLEPILLKLLNENGLKIHSVSSRIKSRESLRYKISRPEKTYHALWDITDLIGLRVITYFEDTIETAARLIEAHFNIDFINSTDKLQFDHYGKFGYRSLHYICNLESAGLPVEAKCEIQIRTVLQHAWAEIEHDLGYKANDAIPEGIRRRFSRIASLLEVADEEFVSIRRDLDNYEQTVRKNIWNPAQPLQLDQVSLNSLVNSPEVKEMDQEIASLLRKRVGSEVFFPDYLIKMLKLSGLGNTGDIQSALPKSRSKILAMIKPYFEFTRTTWKLNASDLHEIHQGYSLFFLSHITVLQSGMLEISKVGKVAQFYRELDYPNDERSAHQVASSLIDALKNAGHGAVIDA